MTDWSWHDAQRRENGECIESPAFTPGVDFDPNDPDEVEIVAEASARHRGDRMRHLERENARLRARVAELEREDDDDDDECTGSCGQSDCERCNPGWYTSNEPDFLDMPSYGS